MRFTNPFLIYLIGGIILFLPVLILGEDVPLPISDQLDSNHVWYKILKDQEAFFRAPWEKIDGYLGSQYRFTYPSPFRLISLLYAVFPVFYALILLKVLIYSVGFASFWAFLNHLSLGKSSQRGLWALIWASLAFYPFAGLGIAGLPILYFIYLYWKAKRYAWACFLLACYVLASDSVIVLIPVVFLLAMVNVAFYLLKIQSLKIPLPLFILFLFLIGVKEYQLIYGLAFQNDFISHRVEFFADGHIGQHYFYAGSLWMLGQLTGVSHLFILPVLSLILFLRGIQKGWDLGYALPFLFASFFLSLMSAAFTFPPLVNWLSSLSPSFGSFNWSRIYQLIPLFILLSLISLWANLKTNSAQTALIILFLIQLGIGNYEWRSLLKKAIGVEAFSYNPSYKEFYDTGSYEEIKQAIPNSYQGYIAHLGIPPAVSSYHGIKTRDGYLPSYDLKDKKAIRSVIHLELEKNEAFRRNFDYWGSKAYLIQSHHPEWVLPFKKPDPSAIPNLPPLKFDWKTLREKENTRYLLSAFPLTNKQLTLLSKFDRPESVWSLHLYQITE
ncbi:DUF6044 family protein [Algoriphagus sp.]|uniref:DUF6044 family protein n=1 Tax=Algoriphagus sp. TaxID=1872435 RepID=UPI0026211A8B|nr:DUF6044 family protein [Algoriphagus sp.]